MADYVTISDTQVDPDAPITSQLAYAWRDNPTAIAEGASGAPRIQTASIENNAVTSSKIENNAVTSSKIKNDAVTSSKIEDNAVTSSKLGTSNSIRDWVLARTAAASAGAVGTYALAFNNASSSAGFGSTTAGSNLRPTDVAADDRGTPTLSGTWRCMGRAASSVSFFEERTTVWLRIS
jgi:hypothetical protein